MTFISHANDSTDNEFTRWLALRLAALGYPVWCDQTQLLGGEKFWSNIEDAIRNRTTKFLVVLSRNSNDRESVLKELVVANRVANQKDLKDFIIPLRIDDLPNAETTIELSLTGVIDFSEGWAPAFAQLVKKLERDVVPKDARYHPGAVADWWRNHQQGLSDVTDTAEQCASNWFPTSDLPERIHLHSLVEPLKDSGPRELPLGLPNYRERGGIFSFEDRQEMSRRLKEHGHELAETQSIDLGEFQRFGYSALRLGKTDARNIVTSLLRQAWEARCLAAGLKSYEMSSGQRCFWFSQGFAEGEKVHFTPSVKRPSGRQPFRRLVARPLKRDGTPQKRLWHFAVQAKIIRWPKLCFAVSSHVIFTEEGEPLSPEKQHSLRRSKCKQWYNDKWLDCMLAAMSFLHDPEYAGYISIPCGENTGFMVATLPLSFASPVSFGQETLVTDDEDESEEAEPDDDESEEEEEEEDLGEEI